MAITNNSVKVAAGLSQTTGAFNKINNNVATAFTSGDFFGASGAQSIYDSVFGQSPSANISDAINPSGSSDSAWKFIVAPENISWNTTADVKRVPIFGSNQSPVVVGAKGMRELELGNALVEGFTRNLSVEGKIQALEDLLNYSLNSSSGFVNVPVYQVTANDKQYGAGKDSYDGGYYVIKDVRVNEKMRDFTGKTTRATVDVSFTQIPPYQVSSGRDQATNVTAGAAKSSLLQSKTAAGNAANQSVGGATAKSGAAAASPKTPAASGAGAGRATGGATFTPSGLGEFKYVPPPRLQ